MKLKLTRRRILTAALAVVGILSGGYWLLTRNVDPRFVGRWAVTTSKSNDIDWDFGRFGNAEAHRTISNQRRRGTFLSWWTEGQFLLFASHNQAKTFGAWLKRQMEIVRQSVLQEPTYTERYEILSVGPDSISLRCGEDYDENGKLDDIFTLRRIQP